jgi:hypothetical protein
MLNCYRLKRDELGTYNAASGGESSHQWRARENVLVYRARDRTNTDHEHEHEIRAAQRAIGFFSAVC